ncbi:MAG: hypothetical protein RJA99_3917 [Pseudomonadota bacterium]|jgi:hypothetical protein
MTRVAQLAVLRRIRELKRTKVAAELVRARIQSEVERDRLAGATSRLAAVRDASAMRRRATLESASTGLSGALLVRRIERLGESDAAVGLAEQGVRDARSALEHAVRRTEQVASTLGVVRRREQAVASAHRRALERASIESESRAETVSEDERSASDRGEVR